MNAPRSPRVPVKMTQSQHLYPGAQGFLRFPLTVCVCSSCMPVGLNLTEKTVRRDQCLLFCFILVFIVKYFRIFSYYSC